MSTLNEPWYQDGLAFSCTRCGACCTGEPGYVWVDLPQMVRLAEHQGLSLESFTTRHVRRVGSRYSLIERPNGDCIFWNRESGCSVYEARPDQCRTWPFWPENLETPEDWDRTRQACPGSGQGRLYSVEEITQAVRGTPL
ncbi:MAG TPA: YkgJ family cysteine cluster protein [Isosphaeraceae bacterium]|nr:YkgJ family cysteine cluster protein [Isosphaeraceae bacterium]